MSISYHMMRLFPGHRGMCTFIRWLRCLLFGRQGERRVYGWRLFFRLRVHVLLRTQERVGRLIQRSAVRVWVDGQEAFPRIEQLIRRARHTVIIQMYIWKDDAVGRRMAARLIEAADRGVEVEVTKEALGDVFEYGQDFLGTKESQEEPWSRFWTHPRIAVHYARNNDHAKVYIIDDHILLLTGMNIAEEYRYDWHDYLVELRGRHLVDTYLTGAHMHDAVESVQLVTNTAEAKGVRTAVRTLLQSAKHSIVIEHGYFSDAEVIDLLIRKSLQGVRVTVVIPARARHHHHANMLGVAKLLGGSGGKVHVFLFPQMIHGKIMLIDHARAFVGSANLFPQSLDTMGEANVLLIGRYRRAVWRIREVLRQDILRSRPLVSPAEFRWISRWLAWLRL